MRDLYNWERLWIPQNELYTLDRDRFPLNPNNNDTFLKETKAVLWESIKQNSCLVLLGEPNSGKSTELKRYYRNHKAEQSNEFLLYADLGEYGEESRLIDDVFRSNKMLTGILKKKAMYLYLDSIDKCSDQIKTIFYILKKELNRLKSRNNEIFLRISCRSGFWPQPMTDFLQNFYSNDKKFVYNLVPLDQNCVRIAAEFHGINSDIFIKQLINLELQALTSFPSILHQTLDLFRKKTLTDESRSSLFEAACLKLCDSNNEDNLLPGRSGKISIHKKYALASRIAATMAFCNKSKISLNDRYDDEVETISVSSFQEGQEKSPTFDFTFSISDIIDTIKETALFHSLGKNQFKTSIPSFSEFLAAQYINRHNLDLIQIQSLISVSTDRENKVVPQMVGVVHWMSALSKDFLEKTISTDPQSLLSSNVRFISPVNREKLLDSYLEKLQEQSINDFVWENYPHYSKLYYPGIEKKLDAIIVNESAKFNYRVRRAVIEVADACKLKTLSDPLLVLALDSNENVGLRHTAINVLANLGAKNLSEIKHLALDPLAEDFEDEIKGATLSAVWPGILPLEEIFPKLTPPKRKNLSGNYAHFLYHIGGNITKDSVTEGLKWILNKPSNRQDRHYAFKHIEDEIIWFAWKNYEDIEDATLFAKVLWLRIKDHYDHNIFPNAARKELQKFNDEFKEIRLKILLDCISMVDEELDLLAIGGLYADSDFHDVLHLLKEAEDSASKKKLAQLLHFRFFGQESQKIEAILRAAQSCPELKTIFAELIEPIQLNSEKARELQKILQNRKKWHEESQNNKKKKKEIKVNVKQRLEKSISNFRKERTFPWWFQITRDLTLESTSEFYGDLLNVDIETLPGWAALDETDIEEIISHAKYVILNFHDQKTNWFGTRKVNMLALAGYKALIFILKRDRGFLEELDGKFWNNWKQIIVEQGRYWDVDGFKALLNLCYPKISKEIIELTIDFIEVADHENETHLSFLHNLEAWIDEKFQTELLRTIHSRNFGSAIKSEILSILIRLGNPDAEDILLNRIATTNGQEKINYAKGMFSTCHSDNWGTMLKILNEDIEFGKEFFLYVFQNRFPDGETLKNRVSEQEIGDLLIWLFQNFPPSEDPVHDTAYLVGARDRTADYRGNLLRYLTNAGTENSVLALEKLKNQGISNIDFHLVEARKQFRNVNWQPLAPSEFLALIANNSFRLILNTTDLQNLILESLTRLDQELQGSNSLSALLWDKLSPSRHKPKSEEILSDYLRHHLTKDLSTYGISSFREVQIRKPNYIESGKQGEKTDLWVTYRDPLESKTLDVIIEVKRSNNSEVNTSMKEQLCDRYLNTTQMQHGIYLIGWYHCESFKNENKTNQTSLLEARAHYSLEAEKLSSEENKTIKAFVLDCSNHN